MHRLFCTLGLLLAAAPASAQTLERIAERGVITIGVREDARPLSWMRDGEPVGYTVDLCLGVMDHLEKSMPGLNPVFVPVTTENRFDKLAAGEIDMLCGATTITLERRARIDFSIPVYVDGASVLMPRDQETDFAGLAGKTIGVRADTTTEVALQATLDSSGMQVEVVAVDNHVAGLDGVLDGRLAAYFADQSILMGLMLGSERSDELVVAGNTLTVEPQAIGLPLGDDAFRLEVDTAISRLYRSGAVGRMFEDNFAPAVMGQGMRALMMLAPIRD